jgi:AraC family transcriptional regulator of adaptative response/methylated-DNA-[protein]-cysteine methyltransferase
LIKTGKDACENEHPFFVIRNFRVGFDRLMIVFCSMEQENRYQQIEKAIYYIVDNYKDTISLQELASSVRMSPSHFQRVFTEWVGVSPKKSQTQLILQHAKRDLLLRKTVEVASNNAGLSSTSRLYDAFVRIERMTPGTFRNGGTGLMIRYSFQPSIFGELLIASTEQGVCSIAFSDKREVALRELFEKFPKAGFQEEDLHVHTEVLKYIDKLGDAEAKFSLHLKGTDFQMKVWEALLRVGPGQLRSYSSLAESIGNAKAVRAVASAVARNPIAFIIPCHRVIQSTGLVGEYHWLKERKAAMITYEALKHTENHENT